jgi:hypothetical protein
MYPIASLRLSEEVVDADVEALARRIAGSGRWSAPIPAERSTGIIMDGNHRWHAARQLGLTHVPCVLLGYDDARVRVCDWQTGAPFSIERILTHVMGGLVFPYKTTRHLFAPALPATEIALAGLRQADDALAGAGALLACEAK